MKLSRQSYAAAAVVCIYFLAVLPVTAQVNPLLTPSDKDDTPPVSSPSANTGQWYRNTKIYKSIIALQKRVQQKVSTLITEVRQGGGGKDLSLLVAGSFLYGLIHAVGPGHRKVILSSYILGEKTSYGAAALTAFLIAVVHAGSAIVLIFGLYALVSGPVMGRFTDVTLDVTKVSYILLAIIGVVLVGTSIWGRNKEKTDRPARRAVKKSNRLLFIIATGAVPCPGAAAVLVFGIANKAPLLGVLAALSMSVGMGVLLVAVVTLTVFIKNRVLREKLTGGKENTAAKYIEKTLEIAGGVIITAFAVVMLLPA